MTAPANATSAATTTMNVLDISFSFSVAQFTQVVCQASVAVLDDSSAI
jgi:hypothetical protein